MWRARQEIWPEQGQEQRRRRLPAATEPNLIEAPHRPLDYTGVCRTGRTIARRRKGRPLLISTRSLAVNQTSSCKSRTWVTHAHFQPFGPRT